MERTKRYRPFSTILIGATLHQKLGELRSPTY